LNYSLPSLWRSFGASPLGRRSPVAWLIWRSQAIIGIGGFHAAASLRFFPARASVAHLGDLITRQLAACARRSEFGAPQCLDVARLRATQTLELASAAKLPPWHERTNNWRRAPSPRRGTMLLTNEMKTKIVITGLLLALTTPCLASTYELDRAQRSRDSLRI
jgi:hypothetical protein